MIFSDEYAISGMIGKIFWRTVSTFYALTLHARGLKVNSFLKLIGVRYIYFGKNVFINGGIWIERVGRYGDKKFSPSTEIGEGACISERVHISAANHVVIGRGVLFGSNIYVSDNGYGAYRGPNLLLRKCLSMSLERRSLAIMSGLATIVCCWLRYVWAMGASSAPTVW